MDSNENLDNQCDQKGIHRIFSETDLCDLHQLCHPGLPRPVTYNQGTTPIDLIAGSPEFQLAMVAAWMLPFGELGSLQGDHCTLGIDFDTKVYSDKPQSDYQNQTPEAFKAIISH